jgi:hypothetical protein
MHSKAITALYLGLLSSTVMAAPRRPNYMRNYELSTRQDDGNNGTNTDFCDPEKYGVSNDDAEMRDRTWAETEAGLFLDKWLIEAGTEDDWVQNMDTDLFDTDSTLDCTSIEGKCDAPNARECRADYAKSKSPEAYWVYVAVGKANNMWKLMAEKAQNDAILTTLQYEDLLSLFDVDEPAEDVNLASILASAFVLGSAGTGLLPDAKFTNAAMTLAIGAFGMMAATDGGSGGVDTAAALRDQIAGCFETTQDQIQFVLDTAFAGGETAQLPNLGSGYETATANWFTDGRWLIDDADDFMNTLTDGGFARQKHGITNILMRTRQMITMFDQGILTPEDCDGIGKSATWIPAEAGVPEGIADGASGACYRLMQPTNFGPTWEPVWDGLIDSLANDYDVDFEEVNAIAWICGLDFPDGDGKVDVDWTPGSSPAPSCFWNIPMVRGTLSADGRIENADIFNTVTPAYGVETF